MKVFGENKRASFDYELLEKFEAGLALTGHEVKAVRAGRMQLTGSFVRLAQGEAWLVGAVIAPYQPRNAPEDYEPKRTRKLLLHRKELQELLGRSQGAGLTLVPLKVYTQNARVKLEFALARGKKKHDRREDIKRRDAEREMRSRLRGG